jgi:ribose/xylose/arabinose/galactoside ABC-type transport system permease subunit
MDAQGSPNTTPAREPGRARARRAKIPTILYAIATLVVLALLFALGNRNFLSAYNLNTIAYYAAILLVVGLGQMCTILVGGIDLSVGGLMSFISVLFVVAVKVIGYWAFPLCLVTGALMGYINGNILTRIKIPSFIATLGTGGILTSFALLVSPLPVVAPAARYEILNIVNGSFLYVGNLLVLTLLIFLVFYILLRFTVIGKSIFYVGSNITMSWMSGIDITKTRNLAHILSSVGASLAAIFLSCGQYGGDPTLGKVYILNSIAAVVVGGTALTGGTGGPVNTLIGALVLAVMENGMNVVGVNAYFQQSILGAVIIISVFLTFDRSKVSTIK